MAIKRVYSAVKFPSWPVLNQSRRLKIFRLWKTTDHSCFKNHFKTKTKNYQNLNCVFSVAGVPSTDVGVRGVSKHVKVYLSFCGRLVELFNTILLLRLVLFLLECSDYVIINFFLVI